MSANSTRAGVLEDKGITNRNHFRFLEDLTPQLAKTLGVTFVKTRTGSPEWMRVFIQIRQEDTEVPLQIGRLNYERGELYNIRLYTDRWIREADYVPHDSDLINARLLYYMKYGQYLTTEHYMELMAKAADIRAEDIKRKVEARRQADSTRPAPKKRSKIVGKSLAWVLRCLLLGENVACEA